MKIAISASGKGMDSTLDMRFGRCEYFQIHDNESKEVRVVENKGQMSGGGAGIAAAQQLIDENVDVIITGNLGPNAFKLIEKSGIKTFKCNPVPVSMVLEEYNNGDLPELKEAGEAHQGMGHGYMGGM